MLEAKGNLWDYLGKVDALFISTNLATKREGIAVMGRGCALEASKKWPFIPQVLGSSLSQGNFNPIVLCKPPKQRTEIWSLPVKEQGFIATCQEDIDERVTAFQRQHMAVGKWVPSWAQKATLDQIVKSARFIQALPLESAVLPRCGAGAGELDWPTVSEILESILDDRFIAISW
jgi:hypothetical protein